MTTMAVSDNGVVVVRNLYINYYDYSNHNVIELPQKAKSQENDSISDVTLSSDGQHMAVITSVSKQLLVYEYPFSEKYKSFLLPRSASKIRFTTDNQQILAADKSGDVLIYNIKKEDSGTKLLGHLSLLLDVLQTPDNKFIITSDRDEKIRVSCYPNTYNIQSYCLGHKEFVKNIEILPHNEKYLSSASGDGYIKIWDYVEGKLCYCINTYVDVNDDKLKEEFNKAMDTEGIETTTLPIVHYTVAKIDENSSFLSVVVHNFNKLLIYQLETVNHQFSHKLIDTVTMERCPTALKFHNASLFLYDNLDSEITIFSITKDKTLQLSKKVKMFANVDFSELNKESNDSIKVLYKRRFDNVQEYQERKRQRLEKSKQ